MTRAMARRGLEWFSRRCKAAPLLALRDRDLAPLRGARPETAPRLVFHVLAGNLFVSGLESMVQASLIGACNLVRCSSADSGFPLLWLHALEVADPIFARSLAVGWWPTGDAQATSTAATAADVTVAFGDAAAMSAVGALVPAGKRFVAHGPKLSLAILDAANLTPDAARALAFDFTIYDQQGCLSPRAAFIEARDRHAALQFAVLLASEMRLLARTLPRRPLTLQERAAHARQRDDALVSAAMGEPAAVVSSRDDSFLVTVRPGLPYSPGAMDRHADVRVWTDEDELIEALSPLVGLVATVAVGGSADRISRLLTRLRPDRICQPGEMQDPPLDWTHDGYQPLEALLGTGTVGG